MSEQNEKAGIGMQILSFFVPLVGIICFFTWKADKPTAAKGVLIPELVSLGIGIIAMIVLVIAGVSAVSILDYYLAIRL